MFRRVRPAQVQASEGQQLCSVCGDIGNGVHFGATTCEGCKKFFRRGLSEQSSYVCVNSRRCVINPRTRNSCRYCRYQKCLEIGMSREAIQMGRPSKFYDGAPPTSSSRKLPPGLSHRKKRAESHRTFAGLEFTPPAQRSCLSNHLAFGRSLSEISLIAHPEFKPDVNIEERGLGRPCVSPTERIKFGEYRLTSEDKALDLSRSSGIQRDFEKAGGQTLRDTPTSAIPDSTALMAEQLRDLSVQQIGLLPVTIIDRLALLLNSGLDGYGYLGVLSHGQLLASGSASSNAGIARDRYDGPDKDVTRDRKEIPDREELYSPDGTGDLEARSCMSGAPHGSNSSHIASWTRMGRKEGPDEKDLSSPDGSDDLEGRSPSGALSGNCSSRLASGFPGFSGKPQGIDLFKNSSLFRSQLEKQGNDEDCLSSRYESSVRNNELLLDRNVTTNSLGCDNDIVYNPHLLKTGSSGFDFSQAGLASDSTKTKSSGSNISHRVHGGSIFVNLSDECMRVKAEMVDDDFQGPQATTRKRKTDVFNDCTSSLQSTDNERKDNIVDGSSELRDESAVYIPRSKQRKFLERTLENSAAKNSSSQILSNCAGIRGSDITVNSGNMEKSSHAESSNRNISELSKNDKRCSSPSVSSSGLTDDAEMKTVEYERGERGHEIEDHLVESTSCASKGCSTLDSKSGSLARADKTPVNVEELMSLSRTYWMEPSLPIPEILMADKHWEVINHVIPAYDRFVHHGTTLNRTLRDEFETWLRNANEHKDLTLSDWIQHQVVPVYTTASVSYCKNLIGFSEFDPDDQVKIIRFGQSPSRILVAALHWFDQDNHRFRNFLSWRDRPLGSTHSDLFKRKLIDYAEQLGQLELDPIEAALLNVLLIAATDYPNLRNCKVIEETRRSVLATLAAYANAKYGSCKDRLAQLFSIVPEARSLGLLHHQMTRTRTMTAEEVVEDHTAPD